MARSTFFNPFVQGILTAGGALVNNRPVSDKMLIIFLGGIIAEKIAEGIEKHLPNTENAGLSLKLRCMFLKGGIDMFTIIATPLIGKLIMLSGTPWTEIMEDETEGSIAFIGVSAAFMTGCGLYKLGQNLSRFFKRQPEAEERLSPTQLNEMAAEATHSRS